MWDRLHLAIEKAYKFSNLLNIAGDINEDQLNLANHKLKHILILNNLTNIITEPTHITNSLATLLDHIAISNNIKIHYAGVQHLDQ